MIVFSVSDQVRVLRCIYHILGPMAEKLDIWHEVQVRFPERLGALKVLINDVKDKGQLLPVTLLLLIEQMRVLLDDPPKHGVLLRGIDRYKHLVRDAQEGLSVLNGRRRAHPHQSTLEIGRVLDLGLHYAIGEAPVVENLAQSAMLNFPVIAVAGLLLYHRGRIRDLIIDLLLRLLWFLGRYGGRLLPRRRNSLVEGELGFLSLYHFAPVFLQF